MRILIHAFLALGLFAAQVSAAETKASEVENLLLEPLELSKNQSGHIFKKTFLPNGQHTLIVPIFAENGTLSFNFYYDQTALENPKLLIPDLMSWIIASSPGSNLGVIQGQFPDGLFIETKGLPIAELLSNVAAGSPTAKAKYLEVQMKLLAQLYIEPVLLEQIGLKPQFITELAQEAETAFEKQDKIANEYLRKQNAKLQNWRKESLALDHMEELPEKLNDLVLKNDRAGVRKMLEAYLPWPVMEPTEINAWKTWLEAIEHPNKKDTVVMSRGIDFQDDKVQRLQTAQGEKVGFFSSVLTKNQGSYTRRLRSLTTNRLTNGKIVSGLKSDSVRIYDQFGNHAGQPKASNFLSFSADPKVSASFAAKTKVTPDGKEVVNGGLLVVEMDRRRLVSNAAGIDFEKEFLAPLIIFPDEVVVFKEGIKKTEVDMELENINKLVQAKTGKTIFLDIQPEEFERNGFKFFSDITPNAGRCSHVLN